MADSTAIVWFRRDLRLAGNPALSAAAQHGKVLPVFLLDEEGTGNWAVGDASRVWLHESLKKLNTALRGKLLLPAGRAKTVLPQLVQQYGKGGEVALFFNHGYEPTQRQAEEQVQRALSNLSIHSFHGNLLAPPDTIKSKSGGIYTVFTPFYKNGIIAAGIPSAAPPLPAPTLRFAAAPAALQQHTLNDTPPAWGRKILAHWKVGEAAALKLAKAFSTRAHQYGKQRDLPAESGVSRLSPHLHFGEISPRQLWSLIGDEAFLRQLVWREFSGYLLYHYPDFPDRNWKRKFDDFPWRDDPKMLQKWQRGETGIPIVDAAMRELWETGYMHNRARMIVASFLTKNLLLHWRHGAQWFWHCLLDADLANNSAGWQWVAGSGADAAPYFRIFNPLLQSEKFDANGDYLCRYLPMLRNLPPPLRHRPWQADEKVKGYPPPMVDIHETRQRALAAYSAMNARG